MATPPFSTSWQPDTPANVQEQLVLSAPKINANWNTIAYWGGQDHNYLGQTTNIGQHLQSTYVTQSAIPSADANNIRLFSQLVTILSTPNVSTPQLFAQYPTGSTLQLTQNISPTVFTTGTYTQTEVSITIGGIIIKIGTLQMNFFGTFVISFGADNQAISPAPPASTPFPASLFFVPVMPSGTSIGASISAASVTGFSITIPTAASGRYCYIAVGN